LTPRVYLQTAWAERSSLWDTKAIFAAAFFYCNPG